MSSLPRIARGLTALDAGPKVGPEIADKMYAAQREAGYKYRDAMFERKQLEAKARQAKRDGDAATEAVYWDAALRASAVEVQAKDRLALVNGELKRAGLKI